jgi:hypothetical protein
VHDARTAVTIHGSVKFRDSPLPTRDTLPLRTVAQPILPASGLAALFSPLLVDAMQVLCKSPTLVNSAWDQGSPVLIGDSPEPAAWLVRWESFPWTSPRCPALDASFLPGTPTLPPSLSLLHNDHRGVPWRPDRVHVRLNLRPSSEPAVLCCLFLSCLWHVVLWMFVPACFGASSSAPCFWCVFAGDDCAALMSALNVVDAHNPVQSASRLSAALPET